MRKLCILGLLILVALAGPGELAGEDCNGNAVPDAEDISSGSSLDCNGNGIPDECDTDVEFVEHEIFDAALEARRVFAADVDGDGDVDVLSASSADDTIAWYPNSGSGTFPQRRVIANDADGAQFVVAADLDGDGDPDALAASSFDNTVAWYENQNGLGFFGAERIISTSALGAVAVHAADLDGDADLDVISVSLADAKIAWYENTDGAGTFGAQQLISVTESEPLAIHAADVDGDGDTDVLATSFGEEKILWYENTDGEGLFGPPQIVGENAVGANGIFPADLDGDGDPDLVATSLFDDELSWFEKIDGLDDYGPQQIISTSGDGANSVFAADLDGDGDLDLLNTSQLDDKVTWYENTDGAGAFGPPRAISTSAFGVSAVVGADLDGDGDVDAVTSWQLGSKIVWYENTSNDCDGDFVPDECEPDCNANGIADDCDLAGSAGADCNANDIPDECDIGDLTSDDCTMNGIPDECEPDCNANEQADSCDIDDLTSDDCTANGVPDECEADCNTNDQADSCDIDDLTSDDCTANGVPDECEPDCNATSDADSCDIDSGASADCNGNAVPDECEVAAMTAVDCNTNGILDECETRLTFARHELTTTADFTRSVIAADLDVDGDFDVVFAAGISDTIAWFENTDGAGSFGPQQVVSTKANLPVSVAAADLDGDRDIDILSASVIDNKIAWYENQDGMGAFGAQQVISTAAQQAGSVFPADVDGDSNIDVLSVSPGDDKIAWYANTDGEGSFGPQQVISVVADNPRSVFAADLDGDLDADVLSASNGDNELAWYANTDGAGTFGPPQVIASGSDGVRFVLAVDLDGDLDRDVLAASEGDDRVAWYENLDGLGSFGPQQVISTSGNGPVSLFAADMDGDSDTDVLAASFFDNSVSWYENEDGLGTFGPGQVVTQVADGVYSIFAVDLDGDGDTDVLSASQDDDTIAWYENESEDCNGNAVPDDCDIAGGFSDDCTANGVPDECEQDCNGNGMADSCDVDGGAGNDCNANGVPDECEPDCNGNGAADSCDLDGASLDCNENAVPDECELDCNGNGIPDDCDIVEGADDCNANDIPDECEPDCNASGIPDDCDVAQGADDCDFNDVPDECDPDCNDDGTPDACDDDCNFNEIPDGCEPDCNGNGVADSCDVDFGPSADCNDTGIPDECEAICDPPCDMDGDRCKDPIDSHPMDKFKCSDVDNDMCDDCSSGFFNKVNDGPDGDGDFICNVGDCDDADGTVWLEPEPVNGLMLGTGEAGTDLTWQESEEPGGLDVRYDTLRSPNAADFHAPAICLETDGADTASQDAGDPDPAAVFHYLIRIENDCPAGTGSMGADSAGASRTGRICP